VRYSSCPTQRNQTEREREREREMGRSRRKYKRSKPKVQVGLPKKNPHVFKPAFTLPPKLRTLLELDPPKWDDKASVIQNYKSFGVVSNPNLLGVRSRTSHIIESGSLQVPPPSDQAKAEAEAESAELEQLDSGSDLEEDGLSSFSPLFDPFAHFLNRLLFEFVW
jgi:nucleolar protein 16